MIFPGNASAEKSVSRTGSWLHTNKKAALADCLWNFIGDAMEDYKAFRSRSSTRSSRS